MLGALSEGPGLYSRQSSLSSSSTSILGKATISNDGATILKLLDVVHPAAKTLVDIAKSQDAEVGGGPGCAQKHKMQQQAGSCQGLCGLGGDGWELLMECWHLFWSL